MLYILQLIFYNVFLQYILTYPLEKKDLNHLPLSQPL